MIRIIEIITSQFDPDPNKRWSFGCDGYVIDAYVEYPAKFDNLDDDELLDLADGDDEDIHYIDPSSVARNAGTVW